MTDDSSTGRRRRRKPSVDYDDPSVITPTKEEKSVVKYLRSKLPEREGKLVGMVVNYFVAGDAVDVLLESHWAGEDSGGKRKYPILFPSRAHAVSYMQNLLNKQMFHRAEKLKKKSRRKAEQAESSTALSSARKSSKKNQTRANQTAKPNPTAVSDPTGSNGNMVGDGVESEPIVSSSVTENTLATASKKSSKEGKTARVKLEMHDVQIFVDGDQNFYVWIYEPVKLLNVFLGFLVLVIIVVCCLFPLWPDQLRVGAWYTSTGALILLGALLSLGALRAVLFGLIWAVTFGRHHFWLLPNLTEDCGVIESFKPLYAHEYKYSSAPPPTSIESKKTD